jgi:23S rRNA pseudouridine1911/1915/1917 synthase
MIINTLTVTEDDELIRIDRFLSEQIEELTRNRIQNLIDQGQLTVNDKVVKANYKVREKDVIKLNIPDAIEPDILPEDLNLDVVYEDDDLIVINKPKGMVVHPAPGHYTKTLVNGLMFHCKGNLSGINGVMRPGIVHRIDKDTTGLIVACKNDYSHNFIAEQLKVHSSTRKYQAICYNSFREEEGIVDAPIGRCSSDRKKMAIDRKSGKNAITHYKVLGYYNKFTHIECSLETGRTHQIRVHMASINHPILGDEVYGPKTCPFNLEGQTLHAGVLGFIHPKTKEYMEFTAPLPEYFEKLLTLVAKV